MREIILIFLTIRVNDKVVNIISIIQYIRLVGHTC
jgi:hypothetical protein